MAAICCPVAASQTAEPEAPARYKTTKGLVYRTADGATDYMKEMCQLDICYPTNRTGYPTIVWFHAGGLKAGKRFIPGEIARQDAAVVAVGYRLHPKVKSPAYLEDAAAAVAWVFENIESMGGDPKQIYVSGASAGGYLTSMIGLDKRWLAAHDIDANEIAGLISLSGQAITHFTVRKEQGVPGTRPLVDDMAPLYHVRRDAPPYLIITGDRDLELLGRYEENAYLWRMMQIVGHTQTELYELEGFNHGQMTPPALPLLLRFVKKHAGLD